MVSINLNTNRISLSSILLAGKDCIGDTTDLKAEYGDANFNP